MSGDVLIYGDAHGEWHPLLRECAERPPDTVVLLGDLDLDEPLRVKLAPLFEAGIHVRWISGNHDADTDERHDYLWGDYAAGNLHSKCEELGGLRVAGLGGVFKERVWYPRFDLAVPTVAGRKECLRSMPKGERWRGGLPRWTRDAIFPEDVARLETVSGYVLITHEAPSSHKYGFAGVDEAARLCGADLVVHGHHHTSYDGRIPGSGIAVQGLGKAEVLRIGREWFL